MGIFAKSSRRVRSYEIRATTFPNPESTVA